MGNIFNTKNDAGTGIESGISTEKSLIEKEPHNPFSTMAVPSGGWRDMVLTGKLKRINYDHALAVSKRLLDAKYDQAALQIGLNLDLKKKELFLRYGEAVGNMNFKILESKADTEAQLASIFFNANEKWLLLASQMSEKLKALEEKEGAESEGIKEIRRRNEEALDAIAEGHKKTFYMILDAHMEIACRVLTELKKRVNEAH